MAQETNIWEKETSTAAERTEERMPMESATGRDMPSGDGDVGDEQVQAIEESGTDKPIGQDHSTDDHQIEAPRDGVGAVQDSSQPMKSRAKINDE
jgi:hypothetical protein